jgi:hypothetical protein
MPPKFFIGQELFEENHVKCRFSFQIEGVESEFAKVGVGVRQQLLQNFVCGRIGGLADEFNRFFLKESHILSKCGKQLYPKKAAKQER